MDGKDIITSTSPRIIGISRALNDYQETDSESRCPELKREINQTALTEMADRAALRFRTVATGRFYWALVPSSGGFCKNAMTKMPPEDASCRTNSYP
jgi:hypothetical protein